MTEVNANTKATKGAKDVERVRRQARVYAPSEASGPALKLSEPLSFWGGVDIESGRIIERTHPQYGASVAGRVLVMPGGRGSSSSSAVLAECIRCGTAPLGIVLGSPDPILTVGAIVAEFLYELRCPVVVCDVSGVESGDLVEVRANDTLALMIVDRPISATVS